MKRLILLLVLSLIPVLALADDKPPAPPVPSGSDDSGMMPPPVDDLNQVPSLPPPPTDSLKALDKSQATPSTSAPPAPPAPPTDSTSSPQNMAPPSVPDVPTATPVPAEPTATPTPMPKKKMKKVVPLPTPTAEPAAAEPPSVPAEAPVAKEETSTSVAGGGSLTDYFPVSEGQKWSYEYLKADENGTKGTRTVECLSQKAMPNGTVRVVLEVTENGKKMRERYSLLENKVEHTMSGDKLLAADFAFKLPASGGSTHWVRTGAGGTSESFRASFGTAQVFQKTYPDCVVVTEKVMKGGKAESTIISYYAKGIGLVAVEVYTAAKQLIQSKSFALTGQ